VTEFFNKIGAKRAFRPPCARLSLVPHQPGFVAGPVAVLFGFALVVELLALGDADFDLGDAPGREIEFQRDQRQAFALHGDGKLARVARTLALLAPARER
jgi:hypothetical protein